MPEMSREELNNEYLRFKSAIEKYKADLEKSEIDLKSAEKNKEDAENALGTAKTEKERKEIQKDLNNAKTAIEDINARIAGIKDKIILRQGEVSQIINQVMENPEVENQVNRAMEIRAERKISKFEKQKEEQVANKSSLEQLKHIIEKHPQAQIFVNNIENKSIEISKRELELNNINKKIEDIDKEMSELDPSDKDYTSKKAKLDADKAKLDTDKTKIEGENSTLKKDRQAERDGLKKLINNNKLNEHIDNLTTRKSLDKEIKNSERLIRRSENKIHDYQHVKESLYENTVVQTANSPTTVTNPTRWEAFKDNIKKVFAKKEAGDPSRMKKLGTAIKSLFSKPAPAPTPLPPAPTPDPIKSFKDEIKLDKDIMKYDVVKDLFEEKFKYQEQKGKEARETSESER